MLQSKVVDVSSAQKVITSVRQTTAISPGQLTGPDVKNIANVLDSIKTFLSNPNLASANPEVRREVVKGSVETISNVLGANRTIVSQNNSSSK